MVKGISTADNIVAARDTLVQEHLNGNLKKYIIDNAILAETSPDWPVAKVDEPEARETGKGADESKHDAASEEL